MSILLGLLTLIATLLTVAVSATVFQLRASDAAGNGLAQAFLAVSMIALWVILAIVLVLAALRQQRYELPWATINVYSLVLFALSAAGQLACLVQLSGRNADGWFRPVLQLTVVAAPLLVLSHVAWRAYGVAVPMRLATQGLGTAIALLSLVALAGMLRPRASSRARTVSSLAYPALLIRGESRIEVIARPDELTSMNSNYVVNRPSDPLVVDTDFAIFVLQDLALAKGSLGLLARGQGVEPVTFRLAPYQPAGTPESVRQLVLRVKYLSADPDTDAAMRRDIAVAVTLDEMIAILSRK